MLAWAAHTGGDMPLARRRFEESLAYRRKTGSKLSVAAELANLGDMAAEEGDLPEAARLLDEALTIGSELNSQYMIANTLPSLAVLAARAGQTEEAAILLGAGEAIATTAGLVPDPNPAVDEQREVVRSRLGPAEMARLLAHGAALPTDEAVTLATEVASRIRASATGG